MLPFPNSNSKAIKYKSFEHWRYVYIRYLLYIYMCSDDRSNFKTVDEYINFFISKCQIENDGLIHLPYRFNNVNYFKKGNGSRYLALEINDKNLNRLKKYINLIIQIRNGIIKNINKNINILQNNLRDNDLTFAKHGPNKLNFVKRLYKKKKHDGHGDVTLREDYKDYDDNTVVSYCIMYNYKNPKLGINVTIPTSEYYCKELATLRGIGHSSHSEKVKLANIIVTGLKNYPIDSQDKKKYSKHELFDFIKYNKRALLEYFMIKKNYFNIGYYDGEIFNEILGHS